MDIVIRKVSLAFSVLILIAVTATFVWRADASYEETKSPASVEEITEVYDALIKKYENEEVPLDRAEILGIIKSDKEVTLSIEQNLKSSHNTWVSLSKLFIGALFLHLIILCLTVQIVKKPKVLKRN